MHIRENNLNRCALNLWDSLAITQKLCVSSRYCQTIYCAFQQQINKALCVSLYTTGERKSL